MFGGQGAARCASTSAIIASKLPQDDRLRLPAVCRALRQACSAPTLFPEVELDLVGLRWLTRDRATELNLSLRCERPAAAAAADAAAPPPVCAAA